MTPLQCPFPSAHKEAQSEGRQRGKRIADGNGRLWLALGHAAFLSFARLRAGDIIDAARFIVLYAHMGDL
jgi:hypothetical protein